MAKLTIAPSPHAAPAYRLPADAVSKVSRTFWWPLAALIVLVALFDPIRGLSGDVANDLHAALLIAGATALVLASNLMIRHNQPLRLQMFDILFLLLIFYLASNFAATVLFGEGNAEGLLRFLRLAAQICVFYAVLGTCRGRPALSARCLQLTWAVVLMTCAFGLLQTFGHQTGAFSLYRDYQIGRTYYTVWPVTAQFAEPALLGQFMVAALFIFFSDVDNIRRHWLGFAIILSTIGLTRSVGALFGLMAWVLFLFVYNYRSLLSLRRLNAKLMLLLLACVAVVAFILLSRVSLVELATMDLPNSGRQRLTSEFIGLANLADRDWTEGMLFGVGESMTETVRFALGAGTGGNALIELLFRYGLVAVVLLWLLFISLNGFIKGLMLLAIFALLGQIDGSLAKPYIWLYIALIAAALTGPRPIPQSGPSNALMGSIIAPTTRGTPERSGNEPRRPRPQGFDSVQEVGRQHPRSP